MWLLHHMLNRAPMPIAVGVLRALPKSKTVQGFSLPGRGGVLGTGAACKDTRGGTRHVFQFLRLVSSLCGSTQKFPCSLGQSLLPIRLRLLPQSGECGRGAANRSQIYSCSRVLPRFLPNGSGGSLVSSGMVEQVAIGCLPSGK